MSFSPDGKFLAYWAIGDPRTGADIWVLPDPLTLPRRSKPFPFLRTEFRELFPQFSPDGKWIAFYSNDTGRQEIYVAPFPGPGRKVRVSSDGGVIPRWSRDRKELFYVGLDGRLMAAAVRFEDGAIDVGTATPLFGMLPITSGYPYDVSPDGERFLTVVPADPRQNGEITVVRNWATALGK
jgi:Tol biopolymer transport system component